MRYTDEGVPVIKDVEIEKIATLFLSKFRPELLEIPDKFPIDAALEYLKTEYHINSGLLDLGSMPNGNKIYGITKLTGDLIVFDKSLLKDEAIYRFTVGHETGHCLLHRDKPIVQRESELIEKTITTEKGSWWKKKLETPIDWVEHHAKVFSASLVMPKSTFIPALEAIQDKMGIVRNIGKVFLDDSPGSKNDYKETVSYLSELFGVSKQAIKIRLDVLDRLIDQREKKLFHISELFAFNTL